jgi:hypothetical protein
VASCVLRCLITLFFEYSVDLLPKVFEVEQLQFVVVQSNPGEVELLGGARCNCLKLKESRFGRCLKLISKQQRHCIIGRSKQVSIGCTFSFYFVYRFAQIEPEGVLFRLLFWFEAELGSVIVLKVNVSELHFGRILLLRFEAYLVDSDDQVQRLQRFKYLLDLKNLLVVGFK